MRIPRQFVPAAHVKRGDLAPLLGMMGLYFLVVFSVGVLRPIRNSIALDGLAATEFYKVYFVSAVVIAVVPLYNRLADRLRWHTLIPWVGVFFAANLALLRVVYEPNHARYGLIFYGWYELFAASLVTQVFLATQITFDRKEARSAVPLIIVGGSVGATLGSFVTGALAEIIGTPNLMLIAVVCLASFAALVPFVWQHRDPEEREPAPADAPESSPQPDPDRGAVWHLRLVGLLVLVTIVIKTVVDYIFNEAVSTHAGGLDATSSFLGYALGAAQWLPIPVLLLLRPLLVRWGLGAAVLILPTVMLFSTAALAAWFSVWTAVVAKACDTTFRYSAERTSREILYFPVPGGPKLRAKTYIDMAIEKGVGKVAAALLIMALLQWMGYESIAWVAAAGSVGWMLLAFRVRGSYLKTLAAALRGRYATSGERFTSLSERHIQAGMSDALQGDPEDIQYALDVLQEAGRLDAGALSAELTLLLDHEVPDVRERTLDFLRRRREVVPDERIRSSMARRDGTE